MSKVSRFSLSIGRIVEINLPCPCGDNDAAKVLLTNGELVLACRKDWPDAD